MIETANIKTGQLGSKNQTSKDAENAKMSGAILII